jgi:hypothetical protein
MKWSKTKEPVIPLPHERMDAHSSPVSDEELESLVEWCWGVATATWENPDNDSQVRVVNSTWFKKWKVLKELQQFRGGFYGQTVLRSSNP